MFALQVAVTAGAETIATTSSAAKEQRLKQLGVNHVIDIGGSGTLHQSLRAAAVGGELASVGMISVMAGGSKEVAPWNPHAAAHSTRRIAVGSRLQFEELIRAIEVNKIRPVIDRVFGFEEAEKAFEYVWNGKHSGKIVIRIVEDDSS